MTGIPVEWWESGEGPPPDRSSWPPAQPAPQLAAEERARAVYEAAPAAAPPPAHLEGEAEAAPAAWSGALVDKLLVRMALVMGRLPWVPASLDTRQREQLARGAAEAALRFAGSDQAAALALMDSDDALEAAMRLYWLTQLGAPPQTDGA